MTPLEELQLLLNQLIALKALYSSKENPRRLDCSKRIVDILRSNQMNASLLEQEGVHPGLLINETLIIVDSRIPS